MKTKLITPLFVAFFAIFAEYSGLDIALERLFYDPVTKSWPWKSNFVTAGILHSGMQDAVKYVMLTLLLLLILSFFIKKLRPWRKGIAYLLAGSLLGPALVGILKSTTHIYTPWDLTVFGGDKPHIRLFDSVPPGLPVGNAFPGGHSSGGFAFLSCYFLLSYYRPKYRYYGLALGLGLGTLFAAAQEIRGAHFLSHDLFSLVICWYSAMAVYCAMFRRALPEPITTGSGVHESDTK